MLYLGFLICSRTLHVTWAPYKRAKLVNEIMQALDTKHPWLKPTVVAFIIRKLRLASLIAPWDPYLSFSLAMALNHAVWSTHEAIRRWWLRGHVWVSKSVQHDLQIVATYGQEPEYSPVWSRYIGLIVPRVATHMILLDDSYTGIGGWLADFNIQWRIIQTDLVVLGFNMKTHQQIQAGASGCYSRRPAYQSVVISCGHHQSLAHSQTCCAAPCKPNRVVLFERVLTR
jgi:hypothetical protein